MSPWDSGRFPKYSPKQPAPEQGIKVGKLGTTWWGQRWIAALEHVLGGDSGRLARGRTYARAGRTHDFTIKKGEVTAKVTGSRAPYKVSIALLQLPESAWQAAIAAMAQKAEFSALLLNSEMPQQIDEAFLAAGTSLFPAAPSDLKTTCSCPDWVDPCKHVAAVHYVLGEALDRDPFLLFELRGRERPQVLTALRAARGGKPATPDGGSSATAEGAPRTVTFEGLTSERYAAAPEPLPLLSFSFEPPAGHASALRQLGSPSSWNGDTPALEALGPLVRSAADAARRLALSEAPAEETTESAPPASPRGQGPTKGAKKPRSTRKR